MYLKLFAHNQLVRGKDKSCIYDLHNNDVVLIPNIFADIIQDCDENPIAAVQKQYAPDDPQVFDQYVQFVISKNLGFTTEEPHLFDKLDTTWNQPHHIQNAILEYQQDAPYEFPEVIQQLDDLLCRQLEIRLDPGEKPVEDILEQLKVLNGRVFRNVTLFLKYNSTMTEERVMELYNHIPKIGFLIVFNSPEKIIPEGGGGKIVFSPKKMEDFPFDGEADHKNKYIVNITYFMEALQFNPYFNRKVAIDHKGNVKNDLKLQQDFGNILELPLKQIVDRKDFQELWHASPDKIVGVKDSALRYCMHLPYALKKNEEGFFEIIQS
jgi:SPASM domain peptide maturase of grasp-with-spasm system